MDQTLTREQKRDARKWVWRNYVVGTPIPEDWHPYHQRVADNMNYAARFGDWTLEFVLGGE